MPAFNIDVIHENESLNKPYYELFALSMCLGEFYLEEGFTPILEPVKFVTANSFPNEKLKPQAQSSIEKLIDAYIQAHSRLSLTVRNKAKNTRLRYFLEQDITLNSFIEVASALTDIKLLSVRNDNHPTDASCVSSTIRVAFHLADDIWVYDVLTSSPP